MADALLSSSDYTALTGDTISTSALTLASGLVRSYCAWNISQESAVSVTLDSEGGAILTLPSLCVTAVSSVVLNGTQSDGSAWPTLTDSVDYEWSQNGTILRTSSTWPSVWPRGLRRVTVVFDSGYQTVPDEVAAVTASVAARVAADSTLQSHLENTGGIQTNETFGQSVTAGNGLTVVECMALDRYRIASAR